MNGGGTLAGNIDVTLVVPHIMTIIVTTDEIAVNWRARSRSAGRASMSLCMEETCYNGWMAKVVQVLGVTP